jgi:catechol 2,3-dioxygenase-like lactoylglutathione lyase family enzyme
MDVKLDHIAFGVPDVAPVAELLAGHLGGRERSSGPGGGGFVFWQWEFAGGGAIEIIVPDGPPDGFLHRFLAARGAGPHHVTFKVPDLHAAIDRARAHGYEPVGIDDRFAGWKEAFLHPKQAQGIVVQFAEAHPELEEELTPADFVRPPFPATRTAPHTVKVVGLLLSSRSQERALRQWQTLLGGALARERDRLVFRWPESPLRIAVRVQPDADEGPVALELAGARGVALPEGPHPALGLPLVAVEES